MAVSKSRNFFFLFSLIVLSGIQGVWASSPQAINFSDEYRSAVGQHIEYFHEPNGVVFSLNQAKDYFYSQTNQTTLGQSISLGIGVEPVWLKFTVNNQDKLPQPFRLAIETPWLDYIDAYIELPNGVIEEYFGGDGRAFAKEPMPHRFFALESQFESGSSTIYMRVESRGPMALPVRLSSLKKARIADVSSGYQYGVLYGIIGALAIYNLVLFTIIRQREYGLYSLYLMGFLFNSLSYTGHIHYAFPTDFGPYFQDWLDAFLMITYSVAGLHFARVLLATKRYAPTLNTFVFNVATYIPLAMVVSALADQLFLTLVLAFVLNSGFALLFIALGVAAVKEGVASAKLFVVASVTAATCIGISTMAVAGVLPYTDLTYKLIEVGMAFEGIFLAVILAQRFRLAQRDKLLAEKYARTDSLTCLRNRRGFAESYEMVWHSLVRNQRHVALVLLDIDNFKVINDTYGHDCGDKVLQSIAQTINTEARKGDISARWGGEEFVLLLPETDVNEAFSQAERLRAAIARTDVQLGSAVISVTASLGVAGTAIQAQKVLMGKYPLSECNLDLFVKCADTALYEAKRSGKNRVCEFNWQNHKYSASGSQLGLNL